MWLVTKLVTAGPPLARPVPFLKRLVDGALILTWYGNLSIPKMSNAILANSPSGLVRRIMRSLGVAYRAFTINQKGRTKALVAQ
jgi:hypothetical protein